MRIVRTLARGAALFACAGLCLAAWASGSAPARAAEGEQKVWLRGAGATFPAPLYEKWSQVYGAANPQVSVTYDAVGSGEGISRFVTGSVDFGASDTRMSDKEASQMSRGVVMVPATAGMIVLAYNIIGIGGDLRLPRDVYVDIFSGKITLWSDPRIQAANPDLKLPKRNIVVVARQDSSGTTHAFTSHLAAIDPNWRQGSGPSVGKRIDWLGTAMLARGNEGVSARIKISDGAIGYVEYGFARRLGLPVASLQNKAGTFVHPVEMAGQAALAAAAARPTEQERFVVSDPDGVDAYPIVTYSWLLLYGKYDNAALGARMVGFTGWGLAEGQRYAQELGYLPLPPAAVEQGNRVLASVRY
ncbi:MAG: phosphate ABC transporter substrate-binding protein PstS [Defluviicoccus sp.]|nr:phosphate ABC transporter substrate-binding protein PstS [Defluviicoccus sp.]MDG4608326.1 phosphate ABC transporter substrate-binding protein PstS [Defluviicoccus sp.]